jgi:hypothetical protein
MKTTYNIRNQQLMMEFFARHEIPVLRKSNNEAGIFYGFTYSRTTGELLYKVCFTTVELLRHDEVIV